MPRVLVLVLLLAACAPAGSGPGAPGPAGSAVTSPSATVVAGVRCPPRGMVVQRTDGQLRYDGAAPDDPAVCVVVRNDGTRVRVLAALYSLPTRDEDAVRRGLASLFPLAVGREATIRRDVAPFGLPEQSVAVSETLRVVGEEAFPVAGTTRPAWVIQRTHRNLRENTTQEATFRVDRATGALLASTGGEANVGTYGSRPFRATGITVPGAGTR